MNQNLRVNKTNFGILKASHRTRFETEAKGNSEIAYLLCFALHTNSIQVTRLRFSSQVSGLTSPLSGLQAEKDLKIHPGTITRLYRAKFNSKEEYKYGRFP